MSILADALAAELKARGAEAEAVAVEWFPTFGDSGCYGVSVTLAGSRITRMYPKGGYYPYLVAQWVLSQTPEPSAG